MNEPRTHETAQGPAPHPAIPVGFSFMPVSAAIWQTHPLCGLLEFRDLGLREASNGRMTARHIRAASRAGAPTAPAPDTAVFLYVLHGAFRFANAAGDVVTLNAGDAAFLPGPVAYRSPHASPDFEAMEIGAIRNADGGFGVFEGRQVIARDTPTAYRNDGPRKYFEYRDLGVAEATGRRAHLHILRTMPTTGAVEGGTGWHCHTMSQIFVVLRGWARMIVEGQTALELHAGDAMTLGKGMWHNVPVYSDDYIVFELCIPADYETIDADTPRDTL